MSQLERNKDSKYVLLFGLSFGFRQLKIILSHLFRISLNGTFHILDEGFLPYYEWE